MHEERAENYLFVLHRYFINFLDLTSTIELVKVVWPLGDIYKYIKPHNTCQTKYRAKRNYLRRLRYAVTSGAQITHHIPRVQAPAYLAATRLRPSGLRQHNMPS
jgi:hypothetical protein